MCRTPGCQLVFLRAQADIAHRGNDSHRIFADRRFGREHDRIGSIHYGVSDIGNFGTCWSRTIDHRLHHLRCRNHNLVLAP